MNEIDECEYVSPKMNFSINVSEIDNGFLVGFDDYGNYLVHKQFYVQTKEEAATAIDVLVTDFLGIE